MTLDILWKEYKIMSMHRLVTFQWLSQSHDHNPTGHTFQLLKTHKQAATEYSCNKKKWQRKGIIHVLQTASYHSYVMFVWLLSSLLSAHWSALVCPSGHWFWIANLRVRWALTPFSASHTLTWQPLICPSEGVCLISLHDNIWWNHCPSSKQVSLISLISFESYNTAVHHQMLFMIYLVM